VACSSVLDKPPRHADTWFGSPASTATDDGRRRMSRSTSRTRRVDRVARERASPVGSTTLGQILLRGAHRCRGRRALGQRAGRLHPPGTTTGVGLAREGVRHGAASRRSIREVPAARVRSLARELGETPRRRPALGGMRSRRHQDCDPRVRGRSCTTTRTVGPAGLRRVLSPTNAQRPPCVLTTLGRHLWITPANK
jgi:hypothetical protein